MLDQHGLVVHGKRNGIPGDIIRAERGGEQVGMSGGGGDGGVVEQCPAVCHGGTDVGIGEEHLARPGR